MSIEARSPPPQFVARLRRALGGRAGWSGFVLQILFVAVLVWIGYEIVANARANLVALAHLRRLCRADPQPAAAVPDSVLVSRRARRIAEPAAKHFDLRQLLSFQPRSGGSEADRRPRSRAVRHSCAGCGCRRAA